MWTARLSDQSETKFGIREVIRKLTGRQPAVFSVNGKNILIRGGGWSSDMMLRRKIRSSLRDQFRYVQDMGLNTIRLEGQLENQGVFRHGRRTRILVMAGWCCCDHWEHWPNWKPQDFTIAEQSLRDQIYRCAVIPAWWVDEWQRQSSAARCGADLSES